MRCILIILVLSGCGNVYDYQIERAKVLCGFHSGIEYITPISNVAKCKDGHLVNLE